MSSPSPDAVNVCLATVTDSETDPAARPAIVSCRATKRMVQMPSRPCEKLIDVVWSYFARHAVPRLLATRHGAPPHCCGSVCDQSPLLPKDSATTTGPDVGSKPASGGSFAEILADVVFRLVPLSRTDAEEMLDDLTHRGFLGPFRGEPAVDRERLVDVLVGLGKVAEEDPQLRSIDVNPLIVADGLPIAVDALIEVEA